MSVTRNPSSRTPNPPAPSPPSTPRWVWVIVMLLTAGIAGGISSLLSHAAGNNVPAAILTGGGAFAGTVGLLLAIAHFACGK